MDQHSIKVLEFAKIKNMLDDCATCQLGKSLVQEVEPMTDIGAIRQAQRETTEMREIMEYEGGIPLGGIRDIREMLPKAQLGSALEPKQLLDVADTLRACRRLRSFLMPLREKYPLIASLAEGIATFKNIEDEIERCISEYGEVLDSASPLLRRIRSQMQTINQRIRDKLNSMITSSQYRDVIQDPVVTIRNDRFVIPIKQERKANFRGVVHDKSASGLTLFVEPMIVVDMNNELRELLIEEQKEIWQILFELTQKVGENAEAIEFNLELLAHIDFVYAKALLSERMRGFEPILNDRGYIEIIQARHPLLNVDYVVPIDVHLGDDISTLVITGPNTGGKTVALKTIGLLTLMAQAGLHVPADRKTQLAVFQDVFADIGDEQSIEQNLSTFSSHITQIIRIFRELEDEPRPALVLLDELGAGTDPTEGAALAISILDRFHQLDWRGVRTVITTHHGALKKFAYANEGVKNASAEFDVKTLQPTYRLIMGLPGSSNALIIASHLGMPEAIIDSARESLDSSVIKAEELIRGLEQERKAMESERRKIEATLKDAEIVRGREEENLRKLEEERKKLKDRIMKEINEAVASAKEEMRKLVAKLQREGKSSFIPATREQIEGFQRSILERLEKESPSRKREEEEKPSEEIKPGDTVFIESLRQKANVLEGPNEQGEVVIQMGALKTTVPLADLKRVEIEEKKPQVSIPLTNFRFRDAPQVSNELHLRGYTQEDARVKIEKYLDDVHLAGLSQVYIVHGKGTGVLRRMVQDFLKDSPLVESFRLGEDGEGGAGVTVVKMKE